MHLLRRCLTHPSPIVRDAAGLGLSLLGDKRAILFLERAVNLEKRPLCKMALENFSSLNFVPKQCLFCCENSITCWPGIYMTQMPIPWLRAGEFGADPFQRSHNFEQYDFSLLGPKG